jgi:hypothetical protein
MHPCLQTSWVVVQLRLQAPADEELVAAAALAPTTMQAFWQFLAWVSQPTTQAVDVCEEIKGVGTTGTGCTIPVDKELCCACTGAVPATESRAHATLMQRANIIRQCST